MNSLTETDFVRAREDMVNDQIIQRGIHTPRVLAAFRRIPRHWFVPPDLRAYAYEDRPLLIGEKQTISQPYMVAVMTDLLNLRGDEKVLEVGTGSGYQAAILAELAQSVHTIEQYADLARRAQTVLESLPSPHVAVHIGDGSCGWPPAAPYEAILVTAAAPNLPQPLIEQLAEGGALVLPVGTRDGQTLESWRKIHGQMQREALFAVSFVPLRGQFGWAENDWQQE